ncbi:thiamine-phosphate kinase [Nitrosomonas cryotolerans]|uniref:Thiamine-monophosphate kinase n=1 Tax=Nitrosomonas cryotolerans ATCC 49181 TaxID=1131553 RepID=A0A1N6GP09_9PROT|nr:thiamine-phosphate kinase [Nitrosomonas cryotolerans]SFP39280.1 thiamine-phosphate kinase [Nitrosomonas cryotolerans]SIO09217.1 thiamine-phosphate kinase [Nitrosomonas cryotolerans ATCC 49181]
MYSEFDLIRHYFIRPTTGTVLGIGDDAALIAAAGESELAISTDTLVAGKHFLADTDPRSLGYKSLAVNLSDMAAMGAKPRWALLSLTLPNHLAQENTAWLSAFSEGFFELAQQHQVDLIGGDTTCGPLNICIQIIGEVPKKKALRRSGAKPGDDIWISGFLGDAALVLAHQQQRQVLETSEVTQCLPALYTPKARVELGQRLIGLAHSAIDISDGLMADLGHILEYSQVSATIQMNAIACSTVMQKYLPQPWAIRCLLAGGDDYELCFTAPPENRKEIDMLSHELSISLTRIGKIGPGKDLIVKDRQGKPIIMESKGYDHFHS